MEHLDPDDLVLLALGDHAGDVAATNDIGDDPRRHLEHCAACRTELDQLSHTVDLARAAGQVGPHSPVVLPPSIWNGIAAELGIGVDPLSDEPAELAEQRADDLMGETSLQPSRLRGSRRDRPEFPAPHSRGGLTTAWRRGLLVAAVVVAVAVGITTGVAIGQRQATPSAAVQYQADLKPMAAGPADAHATAVVTRTDGAQTLTVAAQQLPLRQGYYEVWLYDPTADKMVAVGTLGSAGDGAFTLASTIDLRSYSVVDVSAQDFDGNPAHKTSMLQGPLTQ